MSRKLFSLFVFLLPMPCLAQEAKVARVDPAGISGSLMALGANDIPPAVLERFFALAGEKKANILLVADKTNKTHDFIVAQASERKLRLSLLAPDNFELTKELADQATAVWLCDLQAADLTKTPAGGPLEELCVAVLRRGGVVAASGHVTPALGRFLPGESDGGGLNLLPDAVIRLAAKKGDAFPAAKGCVGFTIPECAALLVQGRRLNVLGDRSVTIHLAACEGRPAREIVLEGKKVEDLTALRRAALARAGKPFPPAELGLPVVEKGTLFIVGGGGTPAGLMERFVEQAGGAKASIVVLPTANPDPVSEKGGEVFRKAGAGKVTVLPGRTLKDVESEKYLTVFRSATGIWFGGGRQWRFVDAYEGTQVHELMKDVLKRGGIIGGTSAGATIQGDYLCRASPFENFTMIYEGYERGLGFLPGVAIDQHFTQRKRFKDMTSLMKTYPQFLGIGIDETTALIVHGHVGEVTGKGQVHFYDGTRKRDEGAADFEALAAKQRYDLKARKVLP